MRDELAKKLFDKFPTMFKPERPMAEALMCFGFECGDGWFQIIWDACEKLEQLEKEKPIDEQAKNSLSGNSVEIIQVKEKYGSLRIYTDYATEEQWRALQEFENKSFTICETCGKEGASQNKGGWIKTECEDCRKNHG